MSIILIRGSLHLSFVGMCKNSPEPDSWQSMLKNNVSYSTENRLYKIVVSLMSDDRRENGHCTSLLSLRPLSVSVV